MLNFVRNIGLPEIIIIAVILIILFGGRKVKELSRGLGESSKELKKVKKEFDGVSSDEKHEEVMEESKPAKEEESELV